MRFNNQDRKDYANYLTSEIEKEEARPELIKRVGYISNLYKDLNNINRSLKA